jgi:methylated-DNA-[protein]-cysteine S-methyltransferase
MIDSLPRWAQGLALVAQDEIPTPLGPMRALATARGLAALLFDSDKYHQGELDLADLPRRPRDASIVAARRWLDRYWSDRGNDLAGLTLDLHGSPFQRAVWRELLKIPFGGTCTYGDIAKAVNQGSSLGAMPRAVGGAVGRNPVAVIVPCHRVIGANGSLTGYASGLPRKERLLQHEGMLLT